MVLEVRFNHMGGILVGRYSMLAVLGAWWVAFAVAAWAVLRLPRRMAVTVVLAGAVLFNVAALTQGPQTSDDLYRYTWDGKVAAEGIDPYRYPPDDPRLVALRDPWLWPDAAGCASLDRPAGCTRMNRPSARTIYPPVAQVWFRGLYEVLPDGSRHKGLQVVHGLVGLGLTVLLMAVVANLGRNPAVAVLWAWSPLAVAETVMDAHVDVLALVAVAGALWALERRRPALGGGLLGVAVAIKLIPGVLLPAGLRNKPVRVLAAAGGVVGLSYLPHVLAVGPKVLGYLPGYLQEEGYSKGGRFVLLGLVGLRGTVAKVVAVALLAAAAGLVALRREPPSVITRSRWMLLAVFLVVTPVQPWYAGLLVVVAVLDGAWELLAVAAAAYPLYFATILDSASVGLVGRASYGIAALVVLGAFVWRRSHPATAPVLVNPARDA
ncbi:MAG: glycosyltransferase family 87 protein [Acidimicrobiales bacterium]